MKKNKYKLLNTLKKIKKNKLSSSLNTLNLEKEKLKRISDDIKEMIEKSNFVEGEILNSSQLSKLHHLEKIFKKNLKFLQIEKII